MKLTQFTFHHIVGEVREPQEQPPQLLVPLEANLDKEEDETDMVTMLFQKVDKSSEKVKAFKQKYLVYSRSRKSQQN